MAGRLSGRAIVVTGAGSGIGRAVAMGLAREGAVVGVLDVSENAAQMVSAEVRAQSLEAMPLRADVSKRPEVAAAFDAFVNHAGKLDVLFNNAGFNKPMRLLDVTEENWRAIMDVNALGTLIGIQEGARRMIPRRSGKFVNTSSIAGRPGFPSFAPYCAGKFAVNALTQAASRARRAQHHLQRLRPGRRRHAAVDQAGRGPDLDRTRGRPGPGDGRVRRWHPPRPAGSPADIVGTAVYLASSDSDYMTGQIVMIDGGMVLV